MSYNFKKIRIFKKISNFSNGITSDNKGNIFICEQGTRRIVKISRKNKYSIIVDNFKKKKFNSPNDICIHSSGTIFFTDPPYGLRKYNKKRIEGYDGEMMYGGCYVFKYNPRQKKIQAVVTNMDRPNGIAFSNDERKIYITNSGKKRFIKSFKVDKNLNLKKPKIFAKTTKNKTFDGIRVDKNNKIWASCGKGIKCFLDNGKIFDYIKLPEIVSNLEFGGTNNDCLFITASTSLYMLKLNSKN